MRIPFALAATMAALALAPAAALAASDGPPLTESTSNCADYPGGLACIPPIDENDQPNAVCTARVNVNGATTLGQLTNLRTCPAKVGFNQAKLTMLQAGCDHAQDIIRLRFTLVSGGTTLRPEIGECVRAGAVVLTRDL